MSDMNLRSGLPAWMRLNGIWRKVTRRPITTDELLAALERLTKNNSVAALIKSGQSDYDFAHEIEESRGVRRRFRGNATPVADGYSTGVKIVFRTIPSMPPALEDLHVEQDIHIFQQIPQQHCGQLRLKQTAFYLQKQLTEYMTVIQRSIRMRKSMTGSVWMRCWRKNCV